MCALQVGSSPLAIASLATAISFVAVSLLLKSRGRLIPLALSIMAWQVFDGSLLFDIEPLDMGPEDDPICAWAETEAAKSIAVANEVRVAGFMGLSRSFLVGIGDGR